MLDNDPGDARSSILEKIIHLHRGPITDAKLQKEYEVKQARQKHRQKGWLFSIVMLLMATEVALMFYVVISQGIGRLLWKDIPFKLDEWVLGAFEAGVLLQTFGLAKIIAKHLFPLDKKQ